jgi:hypothetical protein
VPRTEGHFFVLGMGGLIGFVHAGCNGLAQLVLPVGVEQIKGDAAIFADVMGEAFQAVNAAPPGHGLHPLKMLLQDALLRHRQRRRGALFAR